MGDFDDVYIIPQYSDIERGEIDLSTKFFHIPLKLPILSSPMDTVSGIEMMKAMAENGGLAVHHRYTDYETLEEASQHIGGIALSPSMDYQKIEEILEMSVSGIGVLDVAHGNTKRNLEFCRDMSLMGWKMVSGNICTREAAERYLKIGINYVRVGIGSGSVCLTRTVTGVGRPQYIAIPDIKESFGDDIHIIADGGMANTGDISKAFALGADTVMLGRLLASTKESICGMNAKESGLYNQYYEPILYGEYSGMASADALKRNGKTEFFIEGVTQKIEITTTVPKLMKEIKNALETTCYYCGRRNLEELHGNYEIK